MKKEIKMSTRDNAIRISKRLLSVLMAFLIAIGSVYLNGIFVFAETGAEYEWVQVTSDEDLKNEISVPSKILVMGTDGTDFYYISGNAASGGKLAANKVVNTEELEQYIDQSTAYSSEILNTPYITTAAAVSGYGYNKSETYQFLRSDGKNDLFAGTNNTVVVSYTSSAKGISGAKLSYSKVSDGVNPYVHFTFDENGSAKLVYAYDSAATGSKSNLRTDFLTYENGYISLSTDETQACSFYVFVGHPSDGKQEDDTDIDTNEEESETEADYPWYKWTKITSGDDFEQAFLDIATAMMESDVYSTNKNILNTKDYNARIMIVTGNGKSILFSNGSLTLSTLPSGIDVKSDSFYTQSSYNLPFAKIVEEKRGGVTNYFAIRTANGKNVSSKNDSFIGVEAEEGKLKNINYKIAAKTVSENSISENSFSLSFYDADSAKVHIEANLPGTVTGRFMTASAKSGIGFGSSTYIEGTEEGSFYIFLGRGMTQAQKDKDAKSGGQTQTSDVDVYYKWTMVKTEADLQAKMKANGGSVRVLIVPKNNPEKYLRSYSSSSNYSGNIKLYDITYAGGKKITDTLLQSTNYIESEDDMDALYITSGKDCSASTTLATFSSNYGSANKYFIQRALVGGKLMTSGKCYLTSGITLNFGDDNNGYASHIRISSNGGYYDGEATKSTGKYSYSTTSGYKNSLQEFHDSCALSSLGLSFNTDGTASVYWSTLIKYKKKVEISLDFGSGYKTSMVYKPLEDYENGLITAGCGGGGGGGGGGDSSLPQWDHAHDFGTLSVTQYLRCSGDYVNTVYRTVTADYYNNQGSYSTDFGGDAYRFYIYVAEQATRASYSGNVGGINGTFEGTLVLEDKATIKKDKTLTVREGSTLVINGNVFNYGTIRLEGGTLIVNGILRCCGMGAAGSDTKKIYADHGSNIIVMEGGMIIGHAKNAVDFEESQGGDKEKYNDILIANNSSLSVSGLVLCNVIFAKNSSTITVEHGGILITNRYYDAEGYADITTSYLKDYKTDFTAYRDNILSEFFGGVANSMDNQSEFSKYTGIQLNYKSVLKNYGLLCVPGGISKSGASVMPDSKQYITTTIKMKIGDNMLNW